MPSAQLGTAEDIASPRAFFTNKICPVTGRDYGSEGENLHRPDLGDLKTAGELGYLDKTYMQTPLSQLRQYNDVLKILYISGHWIDPLLWRVYARVDGVPQEQPTGRVWLSARASADTWQREAGLFFLDAVTNIRKKFESDVFDNASQIVIAKVFRVVFNKAPLAITRLMLGNTSCVMDLEAIFCTKDATTTDDVRRSQFRKYFMAMFVYSCMFARDLLTHDNETGTSILDTEAWYLKWLVLTRSQSWLDIHPGVWEVQYLPCRARDQNGIYIS